MVVLLLAATRPAHRVWTVCWWGRSSAWVSRSSRTSSSRSTTRIASSPSGHPSQWASLATDVIHEVLRRSWTGHIVITGIAGFGIGYAMTAHRRSVVHRWDGRVGTGAPRRCRTSAVELAPIRVFYMVGQFGMLAAYPWLIRIGRAEEGRLYPPLPVLRRPVLGRIRRHPNPWRPRPRAGPCRRASSCTREQQRTTARLAAAIGNGDVGTAHEVRRAVERTGARRRPEAKSEVAEGRCAARSPRSHRRRTAGVRHDRSRRSPSRR